jgi:hypothetical protein
VALNEGGGGEWGKDMRGQRHSGEGPFFLEIWGKKATFGD